MKAGRIGWKPEMVYKVLKRVSTMQDEVQAFTVLFLNHQEHSTGYSKQYNTYCTGILLKPSVCLHAGTPGSYS